MDAFFFSEVLVIFEMDTMVRGSFILETLNTVIFGACLAYIFYLFFETFLEQKKWKLFWVDLLLICSGIASNYIGLIVGTMFLHTSKSRLVFACIRLFVLFWIIMLPLAGTMKKKMVLSLFLFAMSAVSKLLSALGYGLLIHQGHWWLPSEAKSIDQITAFSALLLLAIVAIIRYANVRKTMATNSLAKNNGMIYILEIIIPIISLFIFSYLIYVGQAATIGVLLLLVNVITVYLIFVQHYRTIVEHALQEQLQKSREKHYEELDRHHSEISQIRHNLKNRLIAMNAYVQTGSTERAGEEIETLITQLEDSSKYTFTTNAAVNGLLVQKCKQAEEEGIICDFRVSFPSATGFADADLIDLLGNILDNALEACRRCNGKRHIRLDIDYHNNVLLLYSENSTDGKVQNLASRKMNPERHGIGIKSIKQIVEKYNGDMKYQFGENKIEIGLSLFSHPASNPPHP